MINLILYDSESGKALKTDVDVEGCKILAVETISKLKALWKTGNNAGAASIDLIAPPANESLMVTDLIITSGRQVPNSTVTVQFTDGTRTEVLMILNNAEVVKFNHGFEGGIRAWKDAKIQIITDTANQLISSFCAYVKISPAFTKSFDEWDAERNGI